MRHHKSFFTIIMISALTNCSAMDKKPDTSSKPIMLKDGLLTEIPSILVSLKSRGLFDSDIGLFPKKIVKDKPDSLIMFTHKILGRPSGNNANSFFCPIVVRIESDKTINNLGPLHGQINYKETKEACRMKQAFFYPYQQGAIVYTRNSAFNVETFFEPHKKQLEAWIDDAFKNRHWN